jgi:hypothetical protein
MDRDFCGNYAEFSKYTIFEINKNSGKKLIHMKNPLNLGQVTIKEGKSNPKITRKE